MSNKKTKIILLIIGLILIVLGILRPFEIVEKYQPLYIGGMIGAGITLCLSFFNSKNKNL